MPITVHYPPVAVLLEGVDRRRCCGGWIGRVRSANGAPGLDDGAVRHGRLPRRTDRRCFPKIAAPAKALQKRPLVRTTAVRTFRIQPNVQIGAASYVRGVANFWLKSRMLQFVGRTTVSKKINKPQVHGKGPICGKNCTVLGLTDVAEVGVSVQDEVCHVVRLIRSPGSPQHHQNGPKKTYYNALEKGLCINHVDQDEAGHVI